MLGKSLVLLVLGVSYSYGSKSDWCPRGWKNYEGHCYFISKNRTDWLDAKKFCEDNHAYLARITTRKENTFLVQQLIFKDGQYFWLGGTDIGREGTWTWESTGEILRFANWDNGQPDNHLNAQNCLVVRKQYGYLWDDNQCSSDLNFVCEKSATPR